VNKKGIERKLERHGKHGRKGKKEKKTVMVKLFRFCACLNYNYLTISPSRTTLAQSSFTVQSPTTWLDRFYGRIQRFSQRGERYAVRVDREVNHGAVILRLIRRRAVCRDGVSRCGLYCVVSVMWDKLGSERHVDIFQTVLAVKRNRPQLVSDKVHRLRS